MLASPASAAPDFTKSTIEVSAGSPRETDVVTFSIVLRNAGPDDAASLWFVTEWPLMGFLVDADGYEGAEIDHEARTLSMWIPLAAGQERAFQLRVLAPRDSGGDALTLALRAAHFDSETEYWDRRSVTIGTRPAASVVTLGGIGVTAAGVMTLAVLALGALLWLALWTFTTRRAKRSAGLFGPAASALAVTIPLGFLVVFGSMAWRDYRSLTAWQETRCTILGGRLSAQSTTGSRRSTTTGIDTTNYVPVLGLRYLADGVETFSSGYDTGSRIGIGGRGGRTEELSEWAIGASTPCWYDPADPTDVVVLRGFGGAYLFALLPLGLLVLGVGRIRSLTTLAQP